MVLKLDYPENQSCRNDLVFREVEEGKIENWDEWRIKLTEVIAKETGVKLEENDIERPTERGKAPRPIVAFAHYGKRTSGTLNL